MKLINLFIKVMLFTIFGLILFLTGRLLAAESGIDVDVAVDAGFTLLEQILIFTGAGGGVLAGILIKVARQGTKTLLKSLDSNPYVDNRKLHLHAVRQKDNKSIKYFQKINSV